MPASRADFKTILVLDDDPQFHRLIVPVLTSRGHRVLSAHTGFEASEQISRTHVDLVIVDGQLPDVTGIDWISGIREQGLNPVLMFVSAYWRDARSYHKLTKELGVALVLHKPVLAPVFAAEVDILLGDVTATEPDTLNDFEDTLLALRADYARELPVRLQELSGLIHQLREQPDNLFILRESRSHAHKLRGTAASYGFPDLGDAAGAIEDAIIVLQSETADRSEERFADLVRALNCAVVLAHAAAQDVQSHEKLANERLSSIAAAVPFGAMAKILVVDDDVAFLDLLEELARLHGIEVVTASSPGEALDRACMSEIDAALIDVDLGSHDAAFKLALELRALPGYAELPLAFLSGTGHIERMIAVDHVGQCLYIEKPLKSDALQSAIEQLVAIRQATRPRVLLIDDDLDFGKRIAFVLTHEGMHVQTLSSTVNILDDMHDFAPDVLLLDVMMPGVSGFDICRMLRTMPRWRDLPIIFLTGYKDIDTRVACLRCGGDDYLSKPVINEELFTRVRLRLEQARVLRERVDKDNITGLLMRRVFMEQLSSMLGEARRHEWSVTVCMLQIEVPPPEIIAPMVSDTVLTVLGGLLLKRLRPEDLKGRWGANKLILAFRHEPQVVVEQLVRKVMNELVSMGLTDQYGNIMAPKLTCGMSGMPGDGASIHELLEAANRQLQEDPICSASKSAGPG